MSQSRVSKVKVDTDSNVSRLLVTIFPLWKSSHISPIIIKIFPIEVDSCHFIHTTYKFRPCLFLMLGVRCWCESPCPTARAPHSGKLTIISNHKNYFSHRWDGRYTGPGCFQFAIPGAEHVLAFTDHSSFILLKDGTPYESVILDGPVLDAAPKVTDVYMLMDGDIKKF